MEADVAVSFDEAVFGGDKVIHLRGQDGNVQSLQVHIPAGIETGKTIRLRGKGMPRLHGTGSGDLHVRVKINTPASLTARQRQLLEELAEEFGEAKRSSTEKEKSLIDKIVDEVKSAVQ